MIGSFYDATSKSQGAIIKLKLNGRTSRPTEPEVVTSINENYESMEVEVFPNPTTDRLIISTSAGGELFMTVFSPTGLKMMDQHRDSASNAGDMLDVSGLPPGVYTLRVVTSDGKAAVTKFVRRP